METRQSPEYIQALQVAGAASKHKNSLFTSALIAETVRLYSIVPHMYGMVAVTAEPRGDYYFHDNLSDAEKDILPHGLDSFPYSDDPYSVDSVVRQIGSVSLHKENIITMFRGTVLNIVVNCNTSTSRQLLASNCCLFSDLA